MHHTFLYISLPSLHDLVSFAAVIRVVTSHATFLPTNSPLVGRSVAWPVTTLITAAKETMHDYDVKMPNFTIHGDLNKRRRIFPHLSKLECSPQEINSREIRLHLTFSANCNVKSEFILKVTFSLPWPALMLLTSLFKGDRRAERKEYHFSNFSFSYRFWQ